MPAHRACYRGHRSEIASFFLYSIIPLSNHVPATIDDPAHLPFLSLARPESTMPPNTTTSFPTPSCTLVPQKPLVPGLSDNVLAIVLPTIVYAIAGGFFHLLDTYNLFHDYRIHPSEDELKRNHVTKWQCLQTVVRYHVIQISIGLALNHGNGPTMVGDESCKVHRAANMIRCARNLIPLALNTIGIDANRLAIATESTSAGLAQVLAGDYLPSEKASQNTSLNTVELSLAKFLIFFGVPIFQYLVALTVVDTWIYFTHRLCHVNKTLYRKPLYSKAKIYHIGNDFNHSPGVVHAQHHQLYVSYAYGAVYAHWLETLFLDVLSFVLAGEIAQLSARQSMLFGSFATIKTISDHCGYVFPWDPFRLVNNNGATFHDLHHQTWGLKV